MDDGSEDGTLELARALARRDARIRPLARPRAGVVAARNAGLEDCRGRFIALMDADDLMQRRRLELQVRALEEDGELAGVGAWPRLFPRAGLQDGMLDYEAWLRSVDSPRALAAEAFVECPVAHPTLIFRAEVLRELGYRDQGWPEDYDLVLRALAGGRRLGVVPRALHHWRRSPAGLTQTHPAYTVEKFTACKAEFLASGFLAEHAEYLLWGYGGTGRMLRKALLEHQKRPSHVVEIHPGRLGQTIHGAPVIAPYHLPRVPRHPILVSVAGSQARRVIRATLAEMGYAEGADFVCAA